MSAFQQEQLTPSSGPLQANNCSTARISKAPMEQAPRQRVTHALTFAHLIVVWDDPEQFQPERFPLDGPVPTEQNTDYRYIPFSAGPRCVSHACNSWSPCG
jgi:Cytochrome P450